jgi:hypothetical protein
MRHPFQSLQPHQGRWFFIPAFVLLAILTVVFRLIDRPPGIVAFELAGSVATAQAIVGLWDPASRSVVSFGLGLDYVYMLAYSTVIGFACIWAARRLSAARWPVASLGAACAWGLWLAALLDATENVALLAQLVNGVAEPFPQIAAFCAELKFSLIVLGLLYAAYGGLAWLVGRKWREERVTG